MAGEMVITPIEKLKMVPAINTRDENITQSPVNGKPDIQEGIWSKESSVRTSKHFSENASVLVTIIFGKFADTELFFFVKLIFIAFVLWWAFLDIEACINYALKTTNDHNDIRFLIDKKIVENFISYEWLNKRSFRLWWCWTTYILRIRLFNNLCISWFIIIKSDIWILLTFFGHREERNINSFEKFAVAIHQQFNMDLEDDFEVLILTSELSQVRDVHLHEFNELLSDKADLTLQAKYNSIDQLWVFEDVDALLLGISGLVAITLVIKLTALEVALVENQIQKINNINLHRIVLPFNDMVERINQWLDDSVSYFGWDGWILYVLLEK